MWRGEEELRGGVYTVRNKFLQDNMRRHINARKTRFCLNKYITEMSGRECKIMKSKFGVWAHLFLNMPVCIC